MADLGMTLSLFTIYLQTAKGRALALVKLSHVFFSLVHFASCCLRKLIFMQNGHNSVVCFLIIIQFVSIYFEVR